MKNLVLLTITAIVVSIDSFVVGFGVSLNKKGNLSLPSAVALATLTLCFVASWLGLALKNYLQKYVDLFGATLLFLLGIFSLFKTDELQNIGTLSVKECFAVGFTVGLDGAIANLSLVGNGFGLIAPLVIAFFHFVAVLLGQILANKIHVANTNKISALTFVTLAVIKLI